MTVTRIVLVGAGALMVASTAVAAQDRTQGSGIRVSKDRAGAPATPRETTTNLVGGDVTLTTTFDLGAYTGMTEKNITAHMAAGDSLEIQLAQLAQTRATDARVRDYATMLLNDHTAHLTKTMEIITDEDVGAEPMAFDPEGLRMRQVLSQLRNMTAGPKWDAAFLRFQASHHQNEIDLLKANIKQAHDDDLEDHIEKSLGSLAKHRDIARSVGTTIGVTFP